MSSAHRTAALIQRLLALSRHQTLDPKPTDVNRLTGGLEELLHRAVEPAIQVESSFAAKPWPTQCDPHQLESARLTWSSTLAMPRQMVIENANTVLRGRCGAPNGQPSQDVPPGDDVALSVAASGPGMTQGADHSPDCYLPTSCSTECEPDVAYKSTRRCVSAYGRR